MSKIYSASEPTSPLGKRSRTGFSSICSSGAIRRLWRPVTGNFPNTEAAAFDMDSPHVARDFPELDMEASKVLMQYLSEPIGMVKNLVMLPPRREKPRYLLLFSILAKLTCLRFGSDPTLMLSSEVVLDDAEEDASGEVQKSERGGPGSRDYASVRGVDAAGEGQEGGSVEAATDALVDADKRLVLGFEENIPGQLSRGPIELAVLRAPSASIKVEALNGDMARALSLGCQAVMLVEMKAKVDFDDFWQPLAAAMELAILNGFSNKEKPEPVSVVLTDTSTWYFFTVQLVAPSKASGTGGAAGSSAAIAVDEALDEFTAAGHRFRLYNCDRFNISLMVRTMFQENATMILKVFTRMYYMLYPGENISSINAQVEDGSKALAVVANAWVQPIIEVLERLAQEREQADILRKQLIHEQQRADAEQQRANAVMKQLIHEQQRANAEQQRADTEQQRADTEQQKAKILQQKLDALTQLLQQKPQGK